MERMETVFPICRLIPKGRASDHVFCAYCGKELTEFDFKKGFLRQKQHYLCNSDGVRIALCFHKRHCEAHRERKYGKLNDS